MNVGASASGRGRRSTEQQGRPERTPRPSFAMDRDMFFPSRGVTGSLQRTASDSSSVRFAGLPFGIETSDAAEPPPPRKRNWWYRLQRSCDKSMTLRTIMRFVPLAAVALTSTALWLGYANYKTLESSRATAILRMLQPILIKAHSDILSATQAIQRRLNITSAPGAPTPGPSASAPGPFG